MGTKGYTLVGRKYGQAQIDPSADGLWVVTWAGLALSYPSEVAANTAARCMTSKGRAPKSLRAQRVQVVS